MYIIKNALRCISRSKGRNILIGIIVLVISVSACLGLSIRQAAESAKAQALDELSVTATISFDRMAAMSGMTPPDGSGSGEGERGGFDREQFSQMMGQSSSLTLEEYEKYASAAAVKGFYYTLTAGLNGTDEAEPVTTDTGSSTTSQSGMSGGKGMGGRDMVMGAQSDFSVMGVSGKTAMTDFVNGTASVTEGTVFTEGTAENECIISAELATYNDIAVGDSITLANPNNEEELYTLKVVGIYTDSSANENSFSQMGMTSSDPANKIYMSYTALQGIIDASAKVSSTVTDEDTGREYETGLSGDLAATYVLSDAESYEQFTEQVRELGLDESYTVSSADITQFENSLTPLKTLSTTAGYFLIVILAIGAIILIVLNIFSVRERKYEIGVLTAMGMKKGKVAMQFLTEIFAVTLVAVLIGALIGAVTSVPVTNAMLANQVASSENRADRIEQSFGRGEMGGEAPELPDGAQAQDNGGGRGGMFNQMFAGAANYITEINSAMNFTVLLQMLGIAILLTLIAGAASMLFIMRYEPLRILSNRD